MPDRRPPARRSRKGLRHRDDLHVRRHDRRGLVERARPADAHDRRARRQASGRRRGATPAGSRTTPALQRRPIREIEGPRPRKARRLIVEMLRSSGDLIGEPKPITHPVKFYEKGSSPLEIVSSRQWYVRTHETAAPVARAWARARLAPSAHGPPLRGLGRGPERRLEHKPPALLRRPVPRLVPGAQTTARSTTTIRCSPHEDRLPIDPTSDVPDGYSPDRAELPGGSSATLTSWTPGRRRRSPLRSQATGRTTRTCSAGSFRWTFGRSPTRSSARGSSPRSSGRSSSTGSSRGPMCRSPVGCSRPEARRCPSPSATS